MNKRKIGNEYEDRAAKFLEHMGYEILERNFFCRQGEIDIIAREGGYLVFVEVKYRKNTGCGEPQEAVHPLKQYRIGRAALYYLVRNGFSAEYPCRFDVAAVAGNKIRIYRNAFPYRERR